MQKRKWDCKDTEDCKMSNKRLESQESWECASCTFINTNDHNTCEICGAQRPWPCTGCTFLNDESKENCDMCGLKRKSILLGQTIAKWTKNTEDSTYPQKVFNVYRYPIVGPATAFVKETWQKYKVKLQTEARLVVAPGFSDQDIAEHLAFRHPIHIEGPQYGPIHLNELKETIGDFRLTPRKLHHNLRYGVLNWTPIGTFNQTPGIARDVYFLHTWGVNMESADTTDYQHVFQPDFKLDRYGGLLDLLFGIVFAGALHLHRRTKQTVVVRMVGLGLGVWITAVPDRYKSRVRSLYKSKMAQMSSNGKGWLEVRFPQYTATELFAEGAWRVVENNGDPFGDYPRRAHTTILQPYPANATVMIVNAWDDGSYIGNAGSHDDSMDGWTVAGGSHRFRYKLGFSGLSADLPAMAEATLGANALNASYLHNAFFTPQIFDPLKWIRASVPIELITTM